MEVIVVGCGRVGAAISTLLSAEGHNVTIIDKKESSFHRLGKNFNGLALQGNGFDIDTLTKAGAKTADAFVVVTNGDNTNIMACQVAKNIFKIPRVIARLYDPRRAEIYQRLGLTILSGTTLVASMIRDKLIESTFSSYFIETSSMGIIEIPISKKFSGKKVGTLNRKDEFLISTVIKKKGTMIPSPDTLVEEGDVAIGIVRTESVKKIKRFFEVEE